jgi:DNA-binding MarR family transcriptional regulator
VPIGPGEAAPDRRVRRGRKGDGVIDASVDTGAIELRVPRHLEDLGIPVPLVHDLVLRTTMAAGRTSTLQLSQRLALSPMLMTKVVEDLRDLRYIEVQGMEGRDYLLALTEAGRAQAADRMQLCRYVGPAPVSLASYSAVIRRQHASPRINLPALRAAFDDLVISDDLLREVGPAAIAGGAMFLYGPPGTGKSSIAERLLRIYGDRVWVPYSVEVDGEIINVFDPVVHQPVEDQPKDLDPRWVLCRRPCIIVGGELGPEMLELQYQSGSGTYLAPVQMQANNGILVIDDFGRQANLSPQALLNRWIVPLDRQVDYLSLEYGLKFEIPFDAKVVFSTNLAPETLGDEAFFRRIQSKILIPSIADEQFEEVLRRETERQGVRLTADAPTHLRWMSRELGDGDLRPYLPSAVCRILRSICTFEDLPLELNPAMIERIAHIYFTHTDDRDDSLPTSATGRVPVAIPRPIVDASALFNPKLVAEDEASPLPSRIGTDWTTKAVAALATESDDAITGPGTPMPAWAVSPEGP